MPVCARCGQPGGDDATFCGRCGARLPSDRAANAARKVVTVLFADVSGFTALGEQLDPESLQHLMGRWFDETHRVIKRHHGTVEKYMGDAVMAVFGIPVAHEDDAARAARAALEMRETLVDLNDELARRWGVRLEIHTGLNTGEVVVGSAPGGDVSTVGDAVNVAQRLEAAAPPGQVLVGAETARLLEGAAQLDPVDALMLKGKTLPVAASLLVSVESERAGAPSRPAPPFVGREAELRLLRRAFDEVSATRAPRMVKVFGEAGIGKSRLVRAFLDDVRDEAATVVGRCLPYGDGITYWPVAEIVRTLAGSPTEGAVARLAAGDTPSRESELVASRISRAAGFAPGTVSIEEAQWAMRKLLESVARERHLVVVVEDIHWAESSLLDLIEHVATMASGVPLLLVCPARPELTDHYPSWADAGERRDVVSLEPLSAEEASTLIGRLAGEELAGTDREQLLTVAEGNPFFLQQMVAMRAETPDAGAAMPPTIQAVLTSRIDRLPSRERTVIERAAIEGRTFHRGAVAELLPDEHRADLDDTLDELARRGLIRYGRSEYANERAYRFDHILIRDATYNLTSKRLRADLHERHATWLEQRSDFELGRHEELAGYHLEQALECRLELEPAARNRYRPLAARGADHLGTAGRTALAREDMPAALNLLERAIALLPEDDAALRLLTPELGTALIATGRLADAQRVLDRAVETAATQSDAVAEAHAAVARLFLRLQVDTAEGMREVRERFEPLLSTFEATDDQLGLGRLWRLRGLVHWIEARSASADTAWQRAAEHSRRAGDELGWSETLNWLASSAHNGPTPAEEAIARCERIRSQLRDHPRAQAMVLQPLAALRAMRGEIEPAKRLLGDSNATIAEFGLSMHTAVSHHEAQVSLLAGDASDAEAILRAGYEHLAEMGEKALLADTAAMLSQVLCDRGRTEEAWGLTQEAEAGAAHDDLSVQIGWRIVRARLLARAGESAEAKRISAEAVQLAARTDWLCHQADAMLSQGEVLRIAGETDSAAPAIREAIALYERKGHTIGAQRARSTLADEIPV